ncbi:MULTISPECIES: hypothetical protein [unclassified Bradyrhizobium]
MIATVALAVLVFLVALVYIAGATYGNERRHDRRNFAQSLDARLVLICLGFGIAALLNSMPN